MKKTTRKATKARAAVKRPKPTAKVATGVFGLRAVQVAPPSVLLYAPVSACERLTQAGVQEICIFVTHGLFTGSHWKRLWSLGVKHIFCTDTIPACAKLAKEQIIALSIAPLLAQRFPRQETQ